MADTLTVRHRGSTSGVYLVDSGRAGYRDRGIALGGPADPVAAAAGNRLLGQDAGNRCLELTLTGGRWQFCGRGQLALTGADMNWRLNDRPVDRYRVLDLEGHNELRGSVARQQCRAYLTIRGQWAGPQVLSGGFELRVTSTQRVGPRGEAPPLPHILNESLSLAATPAPEWRLLSVSEKARLIDQTYTVSAQSDRQGIRLEPVDGPNGISLPSMLSSAVLPGTVQLAPTGLILLGPDAQTVGGYPRVLQVSKLSGAFQLPPGGRLKFILDQTVRS